MRSANVHVRITGGTEAERKALAQTLERQAKALAYHRGLKVQTAIDEDKE